MKKIELNDVALADRGFEHCLSAPFDGADYKKDRLIVFDPEGPGINQIYSRDLLDAKVIATDYLGDKITMTVRTALRAFFAVEANEQNLRDAASI